MVDYVFSRNSQPKQPKKVNEKVEQANKLWYQTYGTAQNLLHPPKRVRFAKRLIKMRNIPNKYAFLEADIAAEKAKGKSQIPKLKNIAI